MAPNLRIQWKVVDPPKKASNTPITRPVPRHGVFKLRHGAPRLLYKRYRWAMLVLQMGRAAVFRFKQQATADDHLIQTVDLAHVRLQVCARKHRIKFIPIGHKGKVSYHFKIGTRDYDSWLQIIQEHRAFRLAELANIPINTALANPANSQTSRDLACDRLLEINEQMDQLHKQMKLLDTKMQQVLESRALLRQMAEAVGNTRIKNQLLINQTYVDQAQDVHQTIHQITDKCTQTLDAMAASCLNVYIQSIKQSINILFQKSVRDMPLLSSNQYSAEATAINFSCSSTDSKNRSEAESDDASDTDESESEKEPSLMSFTAEHSCRNTDGSERKQQSTQKPKVKPTTPTPATAMPPKTTTTATQTQPKTQPKTPTTQAQPQQPKELQPPITFEPGRLDLPAAAVAASAPSALQILREGGQLPINLYCPVTMLQTLCEELAHSTLLDQACAESDPVGRMALVCAFAVSVYNGTELRTRKPFNPLVGETYEFDANDRFGWRYLAEQVSHSPDITTAVSEGKSGWQLQSTCLVPRFQLSMSLIRRNELTVTQPAPSGSHLYLSGFKEKYDWNKVTTHVLNVMSADRKVAHSGTLAIRCSNQYTAELIFAPPPSSSIQGKIYDSKGQMVDCELKGDWKSGLSWTRNGTQRQLFKGTPVSEHNLKTYYGFSTLTMQLNQLFTNMKDSLPPTDSRFRPDVRCLEQGKLKEAHSLKAALELKQRHRQRTKENRVQPMWFSRDENDTAEGEWLYSCKYWTQKQQSFPNVLFPDLWTNIKT